ncbi:MAG: hypothetical protein ACM31O_07715 [Bacteroidota bacterium]|jgi:hypothetical protein
MYRVTAALFALVLLVAEGIAAPPRRQPPPQVPMFGSSQDILRWINGYRAAPDPSKLPKAVQAMSRLALFKDLDAAGVYVGFTAGVLGANPDMAEKLVAGMFPMPPEDQVVIVRAIAYSGLPNWKELLTKFVERMPARKVLIEHYLFGKGQTLLKLPLDSTPAALDTLWGYYFATGSFEHVGRILTVLPWAKDQNNVEKLTLGSMAKWTLANNALQDKDLLDYLKRELNTRPKEVATPLREVIEAAETFETSRIRKEAMGAIEELKRKGPADGRQFAWWGMAGQTALALGCIVVGALGHPEVGLPCVIGGAVSGAALKLMAPAQ